MKQYIPPNIDDNGGIAGGLFSTRNAIEAGIYAAIIFFLIKFPFAFLPLMLKLIVGFLIGGGGTAFFLFGLNGEPASVGIYTEIMFRTRKTKVYMFQRPIDYRFKKAKDMKKTNPRKSSKKKQK